MYKNYLIDLNYKTVLLLYNKNIIRVNNFKKSDRSLQCFNFSLWYNI